MNDKQIKELLRLEKLADAAFHRQVALYKGLQRAKETYEKAQKAYNDSMIDVYETKASLIEARMQYNYYS